jgi:hypothetical protein
MPINVYCPNMIVKKDVFDKIGYFDPDLSQTEDSEWGLRFNESEFITTKLETPMFHGVEGSRKIFRKWITYGSLRGYKFYRDIYYIGLPFNQALRKMFFFPFDKYKTYHGIGFFVILYLYETFRFLGIFGGLYKFRKFKSRQIFEKRKDFLNSEVFRKSTLNLEVKNI